jgi:hypothetical protein
MQEPQPRSEFVGLAVLVAAGMVYAITSAPGTLPHATASWNYDVVIHP